MKRTIHRIISALLVAVFVNFVFSNTVFTHTHADAGNAPVTHSHPYLPGAHHGHTAQSLDQIAGFNIAAGALQGVSTLSVEAPARESHLLARRPTTAIFTRDIPAGRLRGPPCMI